MWVVDGSNVLGARPDGWWRDRPGAQRRLVGALGALAARTGEEVTVVFDVAPASGEDPPGVRVRVARGRGRNAADDDIVALVAAAPDPAALRVVTSDRALAERVRALGAAVTGARTFRDRLDGG